MISNELLKKKILDQAFTGQLIGYQIALEKNGYYSIPNHWNWLRLKDIVKIVNGFTPLKSEKTFWNKKEINWFTIEDIREQGHYINHTKQYITNKALGKSLDRLLPPKTVLICCTASVGETAITEISLTTNQQFNGLIIKEEYKNVVNPYYLFYYSKTLKDKLILKAGKTTINFVSTKKLGELLIPIPPLEEQEKIVKKIEELFELIDKKEKNDKEKENLKTLLKEKILDSAIHGELVKNDLSLPAIDVEEVKEDVPFDIPSNWKWVNVKKVCDIVMGQSPNGESVNNIKGIEFHQGKKLFGEKFLLASSEFTTIPTKIIEPNTIVMSVRAPVGDINITPRKICIGRGLCSFSPNSYLNNMFLYYLLKFNYKDINSMSKGTTFVSITSKDIKRINFPIPPLEQQKKIVEKIEECFKLIEQL